MMDMHVAPVARAPSLSRALFGSSAIPLRKEQVMLAASKTASNLQIAGYRVQAEAWSSAPRISY